MSVRRFADDQPASFEFTAENKAWAERELAKYPPGRQASAVLALLWRAQMQNGGWLSRAAIEKVAAMLDMPNIRVLEIATFYTMFNLKPVGRYYVQLCGTTPCMLCGAEDIKAVCRERIGEPGARDGGRPVLLDRGRVPRRLLQRADGPDQRRLLRGPDAGEFRQTSRRSGGGQAGQDRFADRARLLRAGRGLTSLTTLYGVDGRGAASAPAPANDQPPKQARCGPTRRPTPKRKAARRSEKTGI